MAFPVYVIWQAKAEVGGVVGFDLFGGFFKHIQYT